MEASYPETEPDQPELEGTAAHWVAADVLKRYQAGEVPVDSDYLGTITEEGVVVTPEMWDAVDGYICKVMRSVGGRANVGHLHVEQKIQIPIFENTIEGTPDVWYVNPSDNSLHIWDFKYGWGIVEAFYNWQLLCYALGVVHNLRAGVVHVYKIVLHVHQPRPYHPDGPVRQWVINPSLLDSYAIQLSEAVIRAKLPNPPLKVGRHCKDCKASHSCPALGESVYTMLDFIGKSLPDELQGSDLGKHLTCLRDLKSLVDGRLDSIEVQALSHIKSGVSVPGWVAEPKSNMRIWAVDTASVKAMGELMGVSTVVEKPITPAQAEKAGVDKKVVNSLVDKRPGELGLRPQAASKTAEKVFDRSVNSK